MIGHLGSRVSALLDGQLSPAETDRAWAHVHLCHLCRDAVEREGWIKTRLSTLGGTSAPSHLKGSLMGPLPVMAPEVPTESVRRPSRVVLGGSAAGVAVLGVVALGLVVGSDAPRPLPMRTPAAEHR